ncbi:MAG TPA: DUF2780 domain-containing protein [Gemmatimonadales bacterium]|nr:DUF2780 domain-containing protein [Gemmatimonadales bacterium]
MDLLKRVMKDFAVDAPQAEKGVGALLTALRLSLDRDTFERVKRAVPGSESMMGRSLMSGGRTGEMAMMTGAGALAASLAAAGFQKDEVPRLVRLVLEHLRPTIGDSGVEKVYRQAGL